jgi:hypothetical protein
VEAVDVPNATLDSSVHTRHIGWVRYADGQEKKWLHAGINAA